MSDETASVIKFIFGCILVGSCVFFMSKCESSNVCERTKETEMYIKGDFHRDIYGRWVK